MKVTVNGENTRGKELKYEESFWTGKRKFFYDGKELSRRNNKLFVLESEEGAAELKVTGNRFTGVRADSALFAGTVNITRKLTALEYILAAIVFIPGILFGAIGGLIGGVLGYLNLEMMIRIKKLWLKIVVSLEMATVCGFAAYGVAMLFLKLLGTALGFIL